jgi:hypothetical protein
MHPNFLEILDTVPSLHKHFKRSPIGEQGRLTIHTNGGTRNTNYWKKLAEICKLYPDHLILFNIDGLSDTNHIYRQYTKFDKIIENAKSFIDAGGVAEWQFLIFPWNKHQLYEASKLSSSLGFKRFVTRQDGSHITDEGLETVLRKKKLNIKTSGSIALINYSEAQKKKIKCNSLSKSMYFLSCDSKLWPCCFIPNGFYRFDNNFLKKRIFDNYGEDFNDLTKYTADEIVKHRFYETDLIESFNNDVGTECKGKINRCADTCTVEQLKKIPIGKIKKYVA